MKEVDDRARGIYTVVRGVHEAVSLAHSATGGDKDPLKFIISHKNWGNRKRLVSQGVVDQNGFPGREERFVMETESDGEDSFSTMVLAQERTRRKDPSNYFKYYEGGWNITDDHYFASRKDSSRHELQ